MNKIIAPVLSLCVLFVLMGAASAQTAPQSTPSTQPAMPAVLQELATRGAQIRYLGRDKGLDGWATILQGQEQYFYVSPDGEAIVMGLLFDKAGHPVTVDQVAKLQQGDAALDSLATAPAPEDVIAQLQAELKQKQALTPSQQMMQDVEAANVLSLGVEGAPAIYAFMDPQCPHCHGLMNDLRKDLLATGQIQLKLIPIGLRDETKAQAAFLLAAPDAQERWYRYLDGDADALPVDASINKQGIERNLAIMQKWKFDATPMVIYQTKAGDVKIVRGRPRDLGEIAADLY